MTDVTIQMKPGSFDGLKALVAKIEDMSAPSLSVKEQTFFAKRLSFLVEAGIPILEGLHVLKEQSKSKSFQRIMSHVIEDVSNGQVLAKRL